MLPDIKTLARNRWPGILTTLGIEERFLKNKHGPCPVCQGKDRFRFDDKDGDGTYYCNAHGAGDGFRLLMDVFGWDFKQTAQEVSKIVDTAPTITPKPKRTPEQARAELNRIREQCKKATATDPVGRYLAGRGITLLPDVLYHPSLTYFGVETKDYPAMIGIIRNAAGKPIAMHRTYLYDNKKAPVEQPKKVLAGVEPMTGCLYIRLFQALPELGIAEGIETACAASQMFSIPVWSVIDASHMEQFIPPSGVTTLRIFSDNDLTYTGQKSAYTLANRLALKGMTVTVEVPPMADMDWLDMLNMPETQNVVSLFKEFNPTLTHTKEAGMEFGKPSPQGVVPYVEKPKERSKWAK